MRSIAGLAARARGMKRHPRLSEEQAQLISQLIDEWPANDPLKWSDVVDVAHKHLQVKWSRQTLEKRKGIKDAYLRQFARRSTSGDLPGRRTALAREYGDRRILNLKAENQKLRETLLEYDRRLVRYVANALANGLSEEQLDVPIRPVLEPTPVRNRR